MNGELKLPLNSTLLAEASPRLATVVWKVASEPGLKVSGVSTWVATQRSGWPNETLPFQSPKMLMSATIQLELMTLVLATFKTLAPA